MATLTVTIKRYIVRALACFETPSDVAKTVKEEFGLEITRMQVHKYDPTKVMGQGLAKELKALFFSTRKDFEENVEAIPIAKQSVRLQAMNKIYQANPKNPMLQLQVMEQAAKELGGAFTNTRKLTGVPGTDGGHPIGFAPAGLEHFYGGAPPASPQNGQ